MDKENNTSKISKKKKVEFEAIVKQNMKRAYFSAFGILGSHDAAMDISQEAFIRAYRNFKKYDHKRNFFTWYYKILRNLCLNFIRDNKNRKTEIIFEPEMNEQNSINPEQIVENKQLTEMLNDAINRLEAEDREIIILREFENYSYEKISEMLKIPVGTVMSRLFYARKKLTAKLKKVMI